MFFSILKTQVLKYFDEKSHHTSVERENNKLFIVFLIGKVGYFRELYTEVKRKERASYTSFADSTVLKAISDMMLSIVV